MAINNYVVTATTTLAAGTPATGTAGEPNTGGAAGQFGIQGTTAGGEAPWPTTFLQGQLIVLDTAKSLYATLNGLGVLRQVTPGQETGVGMGTSN